MVELREALSDCAIGEVCFENIALLPESNKRLIAMAARQPETWNSTAHAFIREESPRLEFERALATFPGSTAKVRVWRRVA